MRFQSYLEERAPRNLFFELYIVAIQDGYKLTLHYFAEQLFAQQTSANLIPSTVQFRIWICPSSRETGPRRRKLLSLVLANEEDCVYRPRFPSRFQHGLSLLLGVLKPLDPC